MSYAEQSGRRNPAAVAVAVGVHLAIGYALLSGLAYQIIRLPSKSTTVDFVPVDRVPPERQHPVPQAQHRPISDPQPQPRTQPADDYKLPQLIPTSGPPSDPGGGGGTAEGQPELPKLNLTRDVIAGADRTRWITTEDYPSTALRQNQQGVVVVSAMIGTDGKVRSCVVTQSSGSQLLDDTTCRLYTKRAHFTPARDADGNPTTAQHSDRFRWQIPNE